VRRSKRARSSTDRLAPEDAVAEAHLRRAIRASLLDSQSAADAPSFSANRARAASPEEIDSPPEAQAVVVPALPSEPGFHLSAAAQAFTAPRVSRSQRRRRDALVAEFEQFVLLRGFTLASATFEVMIEFGVALVERASEPRDILAVLRLLERRRKSLGAPPWGDHDSYSMFTARVWRSKPVSQRATARSPVSIPALVAALPRDDSFVSHRLRVILLLRLVTLMRPGEPAAMG